MEKLTKLHGVGRKTANVVRAAVWGEPGIIVDTHVKRLATERLALTKEKDPVKIEFDLQTLLPVSEWSLFSQALIIHGRHVCTARKPDCPHCPLRELCRSRETRVPPREAFALRGLSAAALGSGPPE
jgi:endonuclease-3